MLVNLIWSFSGDGNWNSRKLLSDYVRNSSTIQMPPDASVQIYETNSSSSESHPIPYNTTLVAIDRLLGYSNR
jgi:hypothetical protein